VKHWFGTPHLDGLTEVARRSRQTLVAAALVGALTGLAVAGFERLTAGALLAAVRAAPLGVQVAAPAAGLLVAAALLRGRSTLTADAYVRAFHDRAGGMDLRTLPVRMAAAVATLGSGSPLGYEGPGLYAGAGIGQFLHERLRLGRSIGDRQVMLVAGAAAGVSAVFKAPLTGLVFALEVPYQDDLARRMLLPAAISSASSYVTFAAIAGTEPILPVHGDPPFNLVDLGGAALVGLAAGILARLFVVAVGWAKSRSGKGRPLVRTLLAGVVLALTVLAGAGLGDATLSLGPGYHALEWAMDPAQDLTAVALLATVRVVGTSAAVGGGGVGGLFIPLVIQGALLGRVMGGVLGSDSTTLFPLVGMAAFLGAGYRVPLAAVVFVAEFTGRPGYVVPGLIAAVVAQLVMGRSSISPYQVAGRTGHLERRLQLPLASVVDTEGRTAPPDATVEDVFWHTLVAHRQQAVPVVDGGGYLGMVTAEGIGALDREAWLTTPVRDVMLTDEPVADLGARLADAIRLVDGAAADRIAVLDGTTFVGVLSSSDLVQLDEVLDRTDPTA
jgi:CIC family chloride channel protein